METTRYEVKTQAATRSKSRQNMTHLVEAQTEEEATYQARKLHIDRVGWNASVWIVSITRV
jgi:hypothetical protein